MKKTVHTNLVRFLVLVLALCMMIPMFMACQDPDDPTVPNDKNDPNTPSDEKDPDEDEKDPTPEKPDIYDVEDSLPESLDYGTTFTILYYAETYAPNFWVDERTGGVIDNAVYDAISRTEERFGVEIVGLHSAAANEIDHISQIRNQIAGGKPDFDLIRGHDVQSANLSLEGAFLDLYEVPNLDFSKPWWPSNTIQSLTFMGQMYLISSSMSYQGLSSTSSVFFNKTLMEDYDIETPYEAVKSGEWYLSDMFASIEDFWEEGDNGYEGKSEDDIFGIVVPWQLYAWQESFGIELVQKDPETGELILNGHDERIYTLFDEMYSVCWENNGGYMIEREKAKVIFGEGRSVYIPVDLGSAVNNFLNYDIEYGIVPYPKLDESQEQYYAGYTDRYFAIPNTCSDPEYVGTILESMSAEGYRQVTPAYFEVALKNRYTKDETSKEMVDLIKQSMILDFAYVYGADKWWSRSLYALLSGKGQDASKDYASYYAGMLPEAEARVDKVTAAFEEMLEKKSQ